MPRRNLKEFYIDFETFKLGLYALEDTTKAPFGTARQMQNCYISDRGGIGPRPGTVLLGTENTNTNPVKGLYTFRKSFDQDEFLLKSYGDELEVYSKNHSEAGWFRLKNGFTSDKEFGFITSLVNVDNEDYCIFCNRYEPYQTWTGAVTQLNGALSGAETEVVVDSVLTDEIFESETATANSATTITVSGANWAASQFVGMYVYIKAGTHIDSIRPITANTSTQITFDTLGTAPGNVAFEIRTTAFPASGTIIYGGTTIAYTGISDYNKFTVASAHAGADNTAVTLVPTEYPENPRGNRMTSLLNRIVVGNVRSALARDSGGALQGFSSGGSYFVSKTNDPTDFTFAATRVAGEGDIVSTPYGGGEITDVVSQEDVAYIFKARYIESISYSQDSDDLAIRTPIKSEVGASIPTVRGSDDIYIVTDDKQITTIGRVSQKDITPQTQNIGLPIKRLLDDYVFDFGRGKEYRNRIYIPAKSSSSETKNDITLVYNKQNQAFEGVWDLSANFMEVFDKNLYYGESTGSNVYQMLTGNAEVRGDNRFPISAKYATHFMNLARTKGDTQALNSLYFEGYISNGTTITFKAWKDFSSDAFLEFNFIGDEETFLDGTELSAFLGSQSLGLQPLGALGEEVEDGRRHFYFRVFFPFEYGHFFSVGFESNGADFNYELTRVGIGLKETLSTDNTRIKSV